MVHKPKHKVHSFRGLLADGGQDEINLERQNLNLAYRIVKFAVMPTSFNASDEYTVMAWREEQTTPGTYIDFSNTDLLGTAYIETVAGSAEGVSPVIIFDNTIFSRNIFITHKSQATSSCNYYIELEEVPVGAATLMQLKLGSARKLIGGSMGK